MRIATLLVALALLGLGLASCAVCYSASMCNGDLTDREAAKLSRQIGTWK
jgi:hypothetical protein